MTIEETYFAKDYYTDHKLVNKAIAIIKFSKNERRVESYKNLLFRMMKDIVNKNIYNYMNLIYNTASRDEYSKDDLIVDAYVVFVKCVEKYKLKKGRNFYFYFNKSLSRNFFRQYQRELRNINSYTDKEIDETMTNSNPIFHQRANVYDVELIYDMLSFTDVERRICNSKILQQHATEFLNENQDITPTQYNNAMLHIKKVLKQAKENGDL